MKIYLLLLIIILGCQDKEKYNSSNQNLLIKRNIVKGADIYNIEIDSSIIYWTGKKITKSHDGTIKFYSGDIQIKNDIIVGGKFQVDMGSIINADIKNETYNQKLVNHLKNSDFFDVKKHPYSYLKIINSEKKSDNEYLILAELTIKNITQPITFNAYVTKKINKLYSNINLSFNRTLFDIKYGSGNFFKDLGDRAILDEINLRINIMTTLN